MYYPSLEEVKRLAGSANLVPVYREVMADLETPVSAYLKIARGPYSFLLESVEGSERIARYSFIGTEPYRVLRTGTGKAGGGPFGPLVDLGRVDPLRPIQEELRRYSPAPVQGLPRFHGGAVGYLAYEAVQHFERLPSPQTDPLGLPEAVVMMTDTLLAFDHRKHRILVISHAHLDGDVEGAYHAAVQRIEGLVERLSRPLKLPPASTSRPRAAQPVRSNMSRQEYERMVARAKEYIIDGDVIQVVLSQRLSRRTEVHPFDLYRALRTVNPSPYMFYVDLDDFHLVGASPEMLVQVQGDSVYNNPIAGTRPRGATEEEDLALEEELKTDEKERAEHIMLVDLGRNDVGRVSRPATVTVDQFMEVERYSHVMHLVSRVTGMLKEETSCHDALRACFPAGTVSGAPKIRAMEIIAELEPDKRGPYAGTVGYFDFSGNMDTCIAIRTMVVKDGTAYVQAGGGIVYDSVPEREFQETLDKAGALLRAIDEAEAMEQWVGPMLDEGEGS